MKFDIIEQTDPAFTALKSELATLNERFDYDALANAYNGLKVGSLIKFEYKEGKMSIVSKQLEKRGLERGVDCTVQSAIVGADAEGNGGTTFVYVTRNTEKATTAVVREKKTEEQKAAAKAAKEAKAAAAKAAAPAAAPAKATPAKK